MKAVEARIISRYTRGGNQMAMVVIHRGDGSNRRSETRHIGLSSVRDGEKMKRVWVGNNPDPTTVRRRENVARLVVNASTNLKEIQTKIAGFEEMVSRELTADELAVFQLLGCSTTEKAKESVLKKVIPTLRISLVAAKTAHNMAVAFQKEVDEAFPLQVEFVGLQ